MQDDRDGAVSFTFKMAHNIRLVESELTRCRWKWCVSKNFLKPK